MKPIQIVGTETIHARSTAGVFTRWRWVFVWLTQMVFYGLPWFTWDGRQAVLFDLEERRFYLFGGVFYPQDLIYLTAILVISALSLFLFTAVAGRLWCGFTCPQTVYTEIFVWIERQIEGDRQARLRLEKTQGIYKWIKKGSKHALWLMVALITGFTFVGYFTPIRELFNVFMQGLWGPWQLFWVLFYALATYGNAGFLRELVCKYMCPYARFQGAMFDPDTLVVTYDAQRGEPRGARGRTTDPKAQGLGDCINCTLCVQVCPTGIDIRQGQQYECIGCGVCIDACDPIMEKMGYSKGLIRYTTQNAMQQKWTSSQMWRRVFRPRIVIYAALLLAITLALFWHLWHRLPFKVDIVRDRGVLARQVEQGRIENVYRLQLMNASNEDLTFQIQVTGLKNIAIVSESEVVVPATEVRSTALRLQIPPFTAPQGTHEVQLMIHEKHHPESKLIEKTTFMIPKH